MQKVFSEYRFPIGYVLARNRMAAAVDLVALAAAAGTTVPGLKLLLGVLVGYPLSCLYLLLPRSTPLEVKVCCESPPANW